LAQVPRIERERLSAIRKRWDELAAGKEIVQMNLFSKVLITIAQI
jgi:hypothetical protein